MTLGNLYYTVKPLIPRKVQLFLRRQIVGYKRKKYTDIWPIDPDSCTTPEQWAGWPDGKRFAVVLTHDVDTQRGHDRCKQLMDIEEKLGFKSAFNFVPERYNVSQKLIENIRYRGFEVGVHGLHHDGKLYASKDIFKKRAKRINYYIEKWDAVGFRSPSMHHNLDWLHELNIKYDASTFDTDPFEPQADGIGTIFPFIVSRNGKEKIYVELPYTLVQDFTLFILMKEETPKIWIEKLDWIAEKGGMALINIHPDYMNFKKIIESIEEYPKRYYQEFLEYINSKYEGMFWHALPCEMAKFIVAWKKTVKKTLIENVNIKTKTGCEFQR